MKMSDITYAFRREIGVNQSPIEWETRSAWSDLTEDEVWEFLAGITADPEWCGRMVRITSSTGQAWTPREWEWDHTDL